MSYQTIDNTNPFIGNAITQAVEECYAVACKHGAMICKNKYVPIIWFKGPFFETGNAVRAFIEDFNNSTRKLVVIENVMGRQECHLVVHNTNIAQIDIVRNRADPRDKANSMLLQPKTCELDVIFVDISFMKNTGTTTNSKSNPYRDIVTKYIEKGWKIYISSSQLQPFTTTEELDKFCELMVELSIDIAAQEKVATTQDVQEKAVTTQPVVPKVEDKDLIQLQDLTRQIQGLEKLWQKQFKKSIKTRALLRTTKLTMNNLLTNSLK